MKTSFGIRLILALCLIMLSIQGLGCSPFSDFKVAVIGEGPSFPGSRAGHVAGLIEGCPLVAGGSTWSSDPPVKGWLADSFFFREGQWSPGPQLPEALADSCYAFDINGLYVAGGTDGTNTSRAVYCLKTLDPKAPWQKLAQLPVPVCNGAGALLSGKFYVACGSSPQNAFSNQMWSLDVADPCSHWIECAALPGAGRAYPAMVAVNGYLYVLGGVIFPPSGGMTVLRDAYRYHPGRNKWERCVDLPLAGYAWSASRVDDRRVLLTGRACENSQIDPCVRLLHIQDMTLMELGDAVTPACCAPSIQIDKDTWWVLGGEPAANRVRTNRITSVRLRTALERSAESDTSALVN